MNHELELKAQAWLDGELSADETREVAAWVDREPGVRALVLELKATKAALADNELARSLPESREFFWSRIAREIARLEATPARDGRPLWLRWWFRFLAPAAIVAALAALLVTPLLGPKPGPSRSSLAEVESPLDNVSSFTFRSEAEGMTVVWINTQ